MVDLATFLGRSPVSIQRVNLSSSLHTATISPVTLAKSAVFCHGGTGWSSSGAGVSYAGFAGAYLSSSTAVTGTGGWHFPQVSVYVVDFGNLVKSVQRGNNSAGGDVTISAVNTSKCLVTHTGGAINSTSFINQTSFKSSTVISFTSNVGGYWQIIEFW